MRWMTVVATLLTMSSLAARAESQPENRYGVIVDLREYPQDTPKHALESVLKAVGDRRVDYLLAHLADPQWVDKRVQDNHGGKFDEFVKETASKLANEPESVKQLRRFLKEGEWEESAANATARLKDVKERVYLRKIKERWYLENRKNAEKAEK